MLRLQARKNLAKKARELRALRGSDAEREMSWEPSDIFKDGLQARLGRGYLHVQEKRSQKATFEVVDEEDLKKRRVVGVTFVSSFGPDSDKSFSGYLPGLTLEEAKKLVYHEASKHW